MYFVSGTDNVPSVLSVDVLLTKYEAHYVCYVFCCLGHPVNRDYLLHASSIPLIQMWCDMALVRPISYSSLSVFYSPIPVAFHIIYKNKNVTAVVTTGYCFKQRAGQVLSTWGRTSASHPAT
jgi:hypothetical protein